MAGIEQFLERLVTDQQFRNTLEQDPQAALAGYELTDEDRHVLAAQLSHEVGEAGTVERRTSKSALLAALSAFEGVGEAGAGETASTPAIAHAESTQAADPEPIDIDTIDPGTTFASEAGADDLAAPAEDEEGVNMFLKIEGIDGVSTDAADEPQTRESDLQFLSQHAEHEEGGERLAAHELTHSVQQGADEGEPELVSSTLEPEGADEYHKIEMKNVRVSSVQPREEDPGDLAFAMDATEEPPGDLAVALPEEQGDGPVGMTAIALAESGGETQPGGEFPGEHVVTSVSHGQTASGAPEDVSGDLDAEVAEAPDDILINDPAYPTTSGADSELGNDESISIGSDRTEAHVDRNVIGSREMLRRRG